MEIRSVSGITSTDGNNKSVTGDKTTTGANQNTQSGQEGSLKVGVKVAVQLLSSKDGIFSVIINGKEYSAKIQPAPQTIKFMAEIIKTDPLLELKSAQQDVKSTALTSLAKELSSFNQKDIATLLKTLSGGKVNAFLSEEIKNAIRNSGNFFENKLLSGQSAKGDSKLEAYITGNDTARSAVTKMQAANILLNGDFFSFFSSDEELDFDDGIMRFRPTPTGEISLYMKVDFTNLGETILSFTPKGNGNYVITVRTEQDISSELENIDIGSSNIKWRKLTPKDGDFFKIKQEDFHNFENFDVKA